MLGIEECCRIASRCVEMDAEAVPNNGGLIRVRPAWSRIESFKRRLCRQRERRTGRAGRHDQWSPAFDRLSFRDGVPQSRSDGAEECGPIGAREMHLALGEPEGVSSDDLALAGRREEALVLLRALARSPMTSRMKRRLCRITSRV